MSGPLVRIMLPLVIGVLLAASSRAATLEFLSGTKLECKVLAKDDATVKVEVQVQGKPVTRTYQLSVIHAVTINDKRYLINELATAAPSPKATTAKPAASAAKSKTEIETLIDKLGRTPPDWFEDTPLNYPNSLDLSWPQKPPGGWDNQKNVGQYYWDVINPNPNKWREGVKLMHHLLSMHKDDVEKRQRAMLDLGRLYHDLHEDYARAAFWWRQAGVDKIPSEYRHRVNLARCYWRLGNKPMALEVLKNEANTVFKIKLCADMGEMPEAVRLANRFSPETGVDEAALHVADGFRQLGKTKDALAWYQKVLDVAAKDPGKGRIERNHRRASASLDAIKLYDLADPARVKDGTYDEESLGYEGPVRVAVTVRGGKIEQVRVTQHREKQFYSSISDTPAKIIAKQGVKGVDATTSATITSEAIINATAKALAKGSK